MSEEFDDIWENSVCPLIIKCDEQLDVQFKSAVSLQIRELTLSAQARVVKERISPL